MPLISVLGRQRQNDLSKLEASLVCLVNSHISTSTLIDHIPKKQNNKIK